MKTPNHRDRLIASLPADLQAGAMDACHKISEDGNDPVVGMFTTNIESTQRGFADQREATDRSTAQLREEIRSLQAKLAESEEREKQLTAHVTKCHTETQITIQEGYQKLTGDGPWRRGNIKKIVDGVVWGLSVAATTLVLEHGRKKSEIEPMSKIVSEHQEILKNLKNLSDDPKALAEYAKYSKEANSEALLTALSIHAISKLMSLPKMQTYQNSEGNLTIIGPKSSMPVGTAEDGRNWVTLANPASRIMPRTTPAIEKAQEAEKKLQQK